MTRCPEKCGKQWRPKQGKPEWQKQKEEETKEEARKKREEKTEKQKKRKQKKGRMIEVKRIAEEWEIWDEEEEAVKSEAEAKKLVPEKFHSDMIVGIEDEEGHDELVAEIIKRLEENDLYMKPEKYKWKVREVGFLRVVIGPDRIKMEEEKMKGILDWLTLKCVKDVQKFLGLANYYHQFIEGFTSIARPLHDIVKKDQK